MEYIDGLLYQENKDILYNHVSQCEKCNNYLENMKKLRFYVSKLKVKEPYYLESKIMAKIKEHEQIRPKVSIFDLRFILKPALSFAISAVIIICSVLLIYTKDTKLSINLPEQKVEKVTKADGTRTAAKNIKVSKIEANKENINKEIVKNKNEKIVNERVEIKLSENVQSLNQPKVKLNQIKKSDEPRYSLSKVDDISVKMAKEIATPSTTNPLLERDKAIIGNNMINPLKGEYCIIKVKVDESSRVKIIIYDKRIRVVSNLIDEQKEPGVYEVKWYGRNSTGDILSEGVYFVYIQIGSNVIKKNVIIVK